MKKYLLILLISVVAFGCKKDNNKVIPKATDLAGKWELREESGGFKTNNIYQPGNGTTFQFNADSTFVQYTSFQLTNQGVYSVVENAASMPQMSYYLLYLNHKIYNVMYLKTDTLVIGSSAADGLASTYVRQ